MQEKVKCKCGRVLLLGDGSKLTAINKAEIDLSWIKGFLVIKCDKCKQKTSLKLDFMTEK